jgi:hypothetical protein
MNESNLKMDPGGALHVHSSSGGCSGYVGASTSREVSIDDQLYEWDEKFWNDSQNNDPFIND